MPSQLPVSVYPARGNGRAKAAPKPSANALIAEVHTMEEKGSDVNLAAHLLNDAWKGAFDVAAVISNDTDLVTPIQMVSVERQKPVFVICPGRWQMAPAALWIPLWMIRGACGWRAQDVHASPQWWTSPPAAVRRLSRMPRVPAPPITMPPARSGSAAGASHLHALAHFSPSSTPPMTICYYLLFSFFKE